MIQGAAARLVSKLVLRTMCQPTRSRRRAGCRGRGRVGNAGGEEELEGILFGGRSGCRARAEDVLGKEGAHDVGPESVGDDRWRGRREEVQTAPALRHLTEAGRDQMVYRRSLDSHAESHVLAWLKGRECEEDGDAIRGEASAEGEHMCSSTSHGSVGADEGG
nr:hypothetical protein CFP56_54933 [Quercus suber]